MNEPLLQVDRLSKHFTVRRGWLTRTMTRVKAVDDVSFGIQEGETLAIVGESGCGKSTLARTILRLEGATAGRVRFAGETVIDAGEATDRGPFSPSGKAMRQLRRQMQLVFQDPFGSLNPRMTIEQNVAEGLIAQGIGQRSARRDVVVRMLAQVGLEADCLPRYPHAFSGGQRQRIAIARALIVEPKLLVLDEPVSSLDVSIQAQIINLLCDLRQNKRLTFLFISHDLALVRHLADHVGVMCQGEIVELAESEELFNNPTHPYTRSLLEAVPGANPGQVRET